MVSIVITAHNNDFFLYETLDSINKSNVNFDYEILLGIDNCQITMDSIKNNLDKMSKKLKVFFFPKVGTYMNTKIFSHRLKNVNLVEFRS